MRFLYRDVESRPLEVVLHDGVSALALPMDKGWFGGLWHCALMCCESAPTPSLKSVVCVDCGAKITRFAFCKSPFFSLSEDLLSFLKIPSQFSRMHDAEVYCIIDCWAASYSREVCSMTAWAAEARGESVQHTR